MNYRKEDIIENVVALDIPSLLYFEDSFTKQWLDWEKEKSIYNKGKSTYSWNEIERLSEYFLDRSIICTIILIEKQEKIFGPIPLEQTEKSEL